MTPGRFITLEGGEGAGKTTAAEQVSAWLEQHGRQVVRTREPGGTAAAEEVRRILLDPATGELEPMTELLLMFAARAENLAQIIRPALNAGQDVLCDRFTDASRAYQGGGRRLGIQMVDRLAAIVHPDLEPDLTLLLDVPVTVGLERVRQRGGPADRFERSRADFLERMRAAYLARARMEPERIVLIDASQSLPAVRASIFRALEARLQ
ncbi:dTMP kinase [Wenzhouxiangella limi]|uniref:Thymidylate kinase n=1 Tax=Wenzhouxiangella limi TaxID=2707351 RepID=A0A845V3J0_9GAMM|nr:dTMP kinase [Wenzhouxiangella limi]NDY94811.1 dTMP kinase [Wenzhouxiangella limi]